MMGFLTEWMTNIIVFILLATVFDMLLPQSNIKKYTKMVIGLLLIAVITTPLFKLISTDFEKNLSSITFMETVNEKKLENEIEMKKREIEQTQHAYILEQMAVQLRTDVEEELMERYGLLVNHIQIITNKNNREGFPTNVDKVVVQLAKSLQTHNEIEVVQMVEINTDMPLQSEKRTNQEKEIANLLANKWDMAEKVEVMIKEEVAKQDG